MAYGSPENRSDKMGLEKPSSMSSITSLEQGWSEKEEARAKRKVDLTVLPLLCIGFLVFQLDRMNLASALTSGFATDIKAGQNTINLGNQLMYLGTVLLEIPSNIVLQKMGPRSWISAQVLVFGLIATMQVFITNEAGFLGSRICLGLAEAGYIPGSIFTLQAWYTKRELARRLAIFFFGMFGANAISPLIASGILKLDGIRGLQGWQWLFLLEGTFTIFVALLILALLPASPDVPKPLLSPGFIQITASDQEVLKRRLRVKGKEKSSNEEEVEEEEQTAAISLKIVWKTVKQYKRWPHFVSTFAVFSTWSPLTTYTPTIIKDLGFDRITANALAAVGASLALPIIFFFAFLSDRTNRRGMSVIAAQICYLVALVTARTVHPHVGRWSRWGLWTAVNAFAVGYHPVHNTWLQLNCHDPKEKSISIAMWVMSAISGLMVGTQYFRAGDGPFYDNGLITMIIMVSIGIFFALFQLGIYVVQSKLLAQDRESTSDGKEPRKYVS